MRTALVAICSLPDSWSGTPDQSRLARPFTAGGVTADTRRAIHAHFDALKPGGWALISFPTPTWLYRVARGAATLFGLWHFHDERPMQPVGAIAAIGERGEIHFRRILWPLVCTQCLIVARKHSE